MKCLETASILFLVAAVCALGGCHETEYVLGAGPNGSMGPYRMTVSLDSGFRSAHGGEPIRIAVVRGDVVVAQTRGTVSATGNPPFVFSAGAVLVRGVRHDVHVWIDSNIGGGTPGLCDPKAIDHQWSTEFTWPTNDVSFTLSYQTWLMEEVCDTFD